MRRTVLILVVAALGAAGCSSDQASTERAPSTTSTIPATTIPVTTIPVTTIPVTTIPAATIPAATIPTTTIPATTIPATTIPATTIPVTTIPTTAIPATTIPASTTPAPAQTETTVIGTSIEGRPITVQHRGSPDGPTVLVIGVIHGNEQAGLQIVDLLETADLPADVDLWLIETMNPDGTFHDVRQNAAQVDLNRNFPYNWGPLGAPGEWEYSGPSAGSEPETAAVVQFMTELQPDLTIWYHQDYNRIAPAAGREGRIRARYAELTGVPLLSISGGTYTGTAATWARKTLNDGVAFIVELGPTLDAEGARRHADAVLTVSAELAG